MILKPVLKGERSNIPCSEVGQDSGGWTKEISEENGIVFVFNATEMIQQGAFVDETRLRKMLAALNRMKKKQKKEKEQGKNGK